MKRKLAVMLTGPLVVAMGVSWPADSAELTEPVTVDCEGWSSSGEIIGGVDGDETLDIIAWDGNNTVIYEDTVVVTDGVSIPIGDNAWPSAPAANPIVVNVYGRSAGGEPWPATGSYFVSSTYGSCDALEWVAPWLQIPGGPPTQPVPAFDVIGTGCAGTVAYVELRADDGAVLDSITSIPVPSPDQVGHLGFGNVWRANVPIPADLTLPARVTVVAGCGSPTEPVSPTGSLMVDLPGDGSTGGPDATEAVAAPTAQPTFTG